MLIPMDKFDERAYESFADDLQRITRYNGLPYEFQYFTDEYPRLTVACQKFSPDSVIEYLRALWDWAVVGVFPYQWGRAPSSGAGYAETQ